MPMQWNDQADARLFANVLKHHVVKLDYQQLARAMGDNVTPKAISHRIAKIKEKAQAHRNRWDPYARLVASSKRVASLKPAPMSMFSEEGDDDEGKEFVDLKCEDEQPFADNIGGVDGGGGVVVGGQMPSFEESCGREIEDTVVAGANCGGGGGCEGDGRMYLLGAGEQGRWPVPTSEFEVYGMYEAVEGVVGKDGVGMHLPCAAPPSYASAVVVGDDGFPENGGREGKQGSRGPQ